MDKILTLIIPSYNMEEYLEYCLDSLLIEKNFNELEVLVINDGSKDKTLEIAKSYETRFPNVFRVIDKENGNYGSCINRGLQEACGKYIKVLDADDSFDTRNFEEFVEFLMSEDVDLVISDFAIVDETRSITKRVHFYELENDVQFESICADSKFICMEMHAVTYRTQILREIDYHQTEGISYTDQQWIFAPMSNVKTVSFFDKVVYRYLVGRTGQTMNMDVQAKRISDRITYVQDMIKFHKILLNKNLQNNVKQYLNWRLYLNIYEVYSLYFLNHASLMKDKMMLFDNSIRNEDISIYKYSSNKNFKIYVWRKLKSSYLIESIFCKLICKLTNK